MSAEMIKLLRKTPIFSTFDSSSLKKISGFFKERSYPSDEVFFQEGTLGDTLYIIKEGAIKITQTAKDGEEETSRALRREGDIFGESGFLDESPRPATAQATKTTKVLQLSRSDFLTILNNHPLIAYQIIKVLSLRLKQSDLRVIEELKEKNEQLQQANRELQKIVDTAKNQAWSDESSGSAQREERIKEESTSRQQIAEEIATTLVNEVKTLSEAFETLPLELGETNLNKSQNTMRLMRNALDSIRGFISDLTASPLPEIKKEPLDLVSFFEEELRLLKSHHKFRDIVFATHFEEGTPKVKGNKRQLQQLLYAILDNAAYALQPTTDRTRTITVEVGSINQEVQIQISDNGIGMSRTDLAKVFKECFTTKRNGLGLGLLSVDRIVKNHGGSIEVYSDEGTYTLLVIKLPAYAEKKASLPQAESALKPQS